MNKYYVERALEILREEGSIEFIKSSRRFIKNKTIGSGSKLKKYEFLFKTNINKIINSILYESYPNPYQTIRVETAQINYRNRIPDHPKYGGGLGQIDPDDWDLIENCSDVEDYYVIRAFSEKFQQGKMWEDTAFYENWSEKYSRLEEHRCSDWQDYMRRRIKPYERLYEDIRQNGYRPNCNEGSPAPGKSQSIRNQLEVMVSINREGEIYFFSGHHRFAISRALEIEIPVHVVCRHKQWQELRDKIYKNGIPDNREDLRGHPDLQDILD